MFPAVDTTHLSELLKEPDQEKRINDVLEYLNERKKHWEKRAKLDDAITLVYSMNVTTIQDLLDVLAERGVR